MKLFRVPRTGLHVELRTRDEHCPPHLHVENEEVPWEVRLAFSFVGDVVRLMDIDPIEDAPSTRAVLARREKGAIQIGTVTYAPRTGEMTLTMKDGARTAMKAGAGVEQWEP